MIISLIAQEIRPDDTYSIKKIAKYLHEQNKTAFTNGNINNIKIGAYLTIPDLKQEKLRKNSFLKQKQKHSTQFYRKQATNESTKPSVDKTMPENKVIAVKKQISIQIPTANDQGISEKSPALPIQRDITTEANYLDLLDSVDIDEDSKILIKKQNLEQEQAFKEIDAIKERLMTIENSLKTQYQEINSDLKQLNNEFSQAVNQTQLTPLTEQLSKIEKDLLSTKTQLKSISLIMFALIIGLFIYTRKLSHKIIEKT